MRSINLRLLIICLTLVVNRVYAETLPYKVTWPTGWELSTSPTASLTNGKNLGGSRTRALLKKGDEILAVIELTCIPRTDDGKANLDFEFNSSIKTIKSAYQSKGFMVVEKDRKNTHLGKVVSLESKILVSTKGFELDQWQAIGISKGFVYSLSFTGQAANFNKYWPELVKIVESLILT